MSGDPFPKERQLAQTKRYRRHVATRKEWERITAVKMGPCRVCVNVQTNGHDYGTITFHHLVARIHGGDDVEDNIVPVHFVCHERVTMRDHIALAAVAESLSESERGYVLRKLGPDGYARLFGVPA